MSTIISTISPGLAESFSPDKTYHTGNIVLYRNKYWVCNTHETFGAWRDDDWTKYEEFVKILDDKLSKKRDVADLFTAWEIKGSGGSLIYPVWDAFKNRWELQISNVTYYSNSDSNSTDATFTASTGETIHAIRKRILTEDDVTTDLTSQTEGKAADAKAVGDALDGKVDNVDGVVENTLTVGNSAAKTVLLGNSIGFVYQTGHGETAVAIMLPMKEGTFALTSDITDATKLTPVFSEWMLGNHNHDMLIRNISATYDEVKKGWETTEELSSDGGQTWNEYTVLADENPDPDKTATSITCISATFVRAIVGYTLGDKDTPTLMSTAGPRYDSATGTVKIFIEE